MIRGGRSWPSEKKVGAGAETLRKRTSVTPNSMGIVGGLLTIEATVQQAEQRLHLSGMPDDV
jgi:hypothetical protein